ncbi:hypothetical protein KNJ79_05155 [Sphingopyxis indica]|uniref:hypothetical protein n=1 Tax=Sphingopyxis indica TaxID=436663 RepID=UPI00293934F3|nr:hypothetical protein [Sphingopyxis indica]WOF44320.1 hypothetical protein KNJ79_05155 [Sphingopyxis indica]
MNRDNLSKLADYLLRLPTDYHDFDMGTFCKLPGTEREFGPGDAHPCGSVGCALGHGPRAGIHPGIGDDAWPDYCENQFGMRWFSDAAEWCFSGAWSMIDDTPHGAGLRIRWMLEGKPIPSTHEFETTIYAGRLPEEFNYLA